MAKEYTIKPATVEYQKMFNVEADHWWYVGLRYVLFYWIKKIRPKKILDAGCGTGINMQKLLELGFEVYGVDYSEDALKFCRRRGLKNLNLGSIEKLPYENSFFDCIYCLDAIGIIDIQKIPEVFKEFNRCLKPGGHLIIQTAAFEFLRSSQDLTWRIKKRYTVNDFATQMHDNGFTVIKSTYRVFLLLPLVFIVKFFNKYDTESDTDKTNWLLNTLFKPVMKMEELLLRFIDFPVGSSLFLVAQKL